ncbi:hypothetical protein [Microbacterium forte]
MTSIMDSAFGPVESGDTRSPQAPSTKRRHRSEKEQLQEILKRAHTLQERLEAKRVPNREQFVVELYRRFNIPEIHGDFDDSERLDLLRSRLPMR